MIEQTTQLNDRATQNSASQVASEILGSRILLAWAAATALYYLPVGAWSTMGRAVGNWILAFGWLVLIHRTTREPQPDPIRRVHAELLAGLALALAWSLAIYHGFSVNLQAFRTAALWITKLPIVSDQLLSTIAGGLHEVTFFVLSALVLARLFGYRLRDFLVGRSFPLLTISLLLVGEAIVGAISPSTDLPVLTLGVQLFAIDAFSHVLSEELLYRGWLLPRIEHVLGGRSMEAVALSALIFSAAHVPIELLHGGGLTGALVVLMLTYPSGVVWGYLYVRTRSIWPGVISHAAVLTMGNLFNLF